MNQLLEKSLEKTKKLTEADQLRLAELIDDFVTQTEATAQFEADLQDPEYRSYIQKNLAEGEADIAAGRLHTADEILARSNHRLKKLHG